MYIMQQQQDMQLLYHRSRYSLHASIMLQFMVLCWPGIAMQALSALPKQQILFEVVHGQVQQQLILVNNAQGMALTFAPQQQIFAINNAHWSALSITPTKDART